MRASFLSSMICLTVAGCGAACGGGADSAAVDAGSTDGARLDATGDSATGADGRVDSVTTVDGPADVSTGACGGRTCGAGQVCTRTHSVGGECMGCGIDGGACPAGTHCSASCCVADVTVYDYQCTTLPKACDASPRICGSTCADALCGFGACACESIEGDLVTCRCTAV